MTGVFDGLDDAHVKNRSLNSPSKAVVLAVRLFVEPRDRIEDSNQNRRESGQVWFPNSDFHRRSNPISRFYGDGVYRPAAKPHGGNG